MKRVFSLRFWGFCKVLGISCKMVDFRLEAGYSATFVFGVVRVNEKN